MLKKIIFILALLALLVFCAGGLAFYYLIAINPGEGINHKYLEKVLAVESPVFYADGENKIGVFFEDAHRQYVPYSRIPQSFINSIIAAEDNKFYSHYGVDVPGIVRAMIANFKAGRVVQGGSTITQQTAKNLYKRTDRSIKEKLKELMYAWRLEYHFSKEKILEFYSNQFYVSGNGRGLGVAARYYFDKPAEELDLIESAFIAGSVKRPNYYNPFTKKDEESFAMAQRRSKERVRYVLDRMYQLKMISAEEYQQNINLDVPFKKGQMTYSVNTILDLVKEALAEPDVETALVTAGIDNVATSGIRIITTIVKDIQEQSVDALSRNLSSLSVRLEGYDSKALQAEYLLKQAKNKNKIAVGQYVFGKIVAITSGENYAVKVSFGEKRRGGSQNIEGLIDQDGLRAVLSSLVKYNKNAWSEVGEQDWASFISSLSVGDLVYVRVREYDDINDNYLLDLEKYPEVEGAAVVLEDGFIRAITGGHENRFFNRVMARRLMGSVAKPILYTAAIQLGWNSMDLLNNERAAFVYQGQTYFPRPDHISPYGGVSMSWAGTKSENVASVWLLSNLCERLSEGQFQEVAEKVGLARRKDESYLLYKERIRDQEGILVNDKLLSVLAFNNGIEDIGPDLIFSGKTAEYNILRRLHFRFDEPEIDEDLSAKEIEIRSKILKNSYVELENRAAQLDSYVRRMASATMGFGWFESSGEAEDEVSANARMYFNEAGNIYSFGDHPAEGIWFVLGQDELRRRIKAISESGGKWDWGEVLLNGLVSKSTLNALQEAMDREFRRLVEQQAYDPEILYQLKDFRTLVGIKYLINLCKELGISSPLEPVLSFPLGSNVITLLDMVKAYETIISGQRKALGRYGSGDGLMVIDRIERASGELIYQPRRVRKNVVDHQTSLAVADILRSVVKFGTGRSATKDVVLRSRDPQRDAILENLRLPVPVLGKTGTANGFRNASFVGFVPGNDGGKEFNLKTGYTIASYVGYDDNRPLVKGTNRISGSSGALPIWNEIASSIVLHNNYAGKLKPEDLAETKVSDLVLRYPDLGQIFVRADIDSRLRFDDNGKISYANQYADVKHGNGFITFGEADAYGRLKAKRYFRPYWYLAY